jgi:CMP-N,N'-diacetyllegionaminic acid synthase
MKVLGLVPARGGSKRLHRKNVADLGGKPLIAWTLEAAKKAGTDTGIFDEIVVSTEDEEIGNIALRYGVTWHLRDKSLAQDNTPSLPVVLDAVERYPADVIVLLQPTSPFRTADDIINSIEMLFQTKADSVISVTEAPSDLAFEVGHAKRLRQVPNIVVPNGALFLITNQALQQGLTWFNGHVYGYPMPKDRSLDIDTNIDLQLANFMLKNNLCGSAR